MYSSGRKFKFSTIYGSVKFNFPAMTTQSPITTFLLYPFNSGSGPRSGLPLVYRISMFLGVNLYHKCMCKCEIAKVQIGGKIAGDKAHRLTHAQTYFLSRNFFQEDSATNLDLAA